MSTRRPVPPLLGILLVVLVGAWGLTFFFKPRPHNVVLFVADGLRYGSVTPETAPTMAAIRDQGVDFQNSHALYPTLTTVNASAFATGHGIGDTGDFANTTYPGQPPLPSAGADRTPFLENDQTLADLDRRYPPSYLDETSLLKAARAAGYQTAAVGKLGPALVQDLTAEDDRDQDSGKTPIVIDDATGHPGAGAPDLPAEIVQAIKAAGLPVQAPGRGSNGQAGDFAHRGTQSANVEQQDWFTAVAAKVLLPRFKARNKPFALVFWSRDPDGTQHDQGDSLGQLTPGINGPTSLKAIHNADDDLKRLRQTLKDLGLEKTTDIIVVADHGFATIARQSATSAAARMRFKDVKPGLLPPGFAAIDLSVALNLNLFDANGRPVDIRRGLHSGDGSGLLGEADKPEAIIAANGGSDLIWLPQGDAKTMAPKIVKALIAQDYVAAVFVRDDLGRIPGTLPTSAIGLEGAAVTPKPAIVVSFRTFSTGCADPLMCAALVADINLQQGQGAHGSLSRAETRNFMAATGPDFKDGYKDLAPISNADIGATLAKIMGLKLKPKGALVGRVADEAFVKNPTDGPDAVTRELRSEPAENGFVTVLHEQTLKGRVYFDWAGAPGRVVTGKP